MPSTTSASDARSAAVTTSVGLDLVSGSPRPLCISKARLPAARASSTAIASRAAGSGAVMRAVCLPPRCGSRHLRLLERHSVFHRPHHPGREAPVDLRFSEQDEEFRRELRSWLDANLPAEMREPAFWADMSS